MLALSRIPHDSRILDSGQSASQEALSPCVATAEAGHRALLSRERRFKVWSLQHDPLMWIQPDLHRFTQEYRESLNCIATIGCESHVNPHDMVQAKIQDENDENDHRKS